MSVALIPHGDVLLLVTLSPASRNLFFRVSSLTLMGIKLVFVMEGEAPELKAETMSKRTEARYGGFRKASSSSSHKTTGRGRFKAVLREVGHSLIPAERLSCISVLHLSLSVLICWTYWECLG